MSRSLVAKIKAANLALITSGNLDAVGEFFAPDYVAHVTGQETARRTNERGRPEAPLRTAGAAVS